VKNETFEQMALRVAKEIEVPAFGPAWAIAFAARIKEELCKGQKPAYWRFVHGDGSISFSSKVQVGTPLYPHPAPIPADMVMLPRELLRWILDNANDPAYWLTQVEAAYEQEQK
jgi:hypothetical protein